MASFSRQRGTIINALRDAGISADVSARVASVLGNSSQEMYHNGDVVLDSTEPGMRIVRTARRKQRYQNLDFRDNDPDYRSRQTPDSERRVPAEPPPNVVNITAPQVVRAYRGIAPGQLVQVRPTATATVVGVRNKVNAQPAGGLPIAMLDAQGNTFVGKAPRARGRSVRFDVQQNANEVVWNLSVPALRQRRTFDVVTGIKFVEGKGLEVEYGTIQAWGAARARQKRVIKTPKQDVVTKITQDSRGIRCERSQVAVLSAKKSQPSVFNTFRIGTFQGAWAIGDTKEVSQVWPNSARTVTVENLITTAPDTSVPGEDRWVLYAVRTQDKTIGKHNASAPKDYRRWPKAKYYAIAIQGPEEPVSVVTNVSLTPEGLQFDRKKVYAWSEDDSPLFIPTTDCAESPPLPPPDPPY